MAAHRPDDEVLSALLDTEQGASEAAHVAGCVACQGRLNELRAASRLAATAPAHVPGHVREAAVAQALKAAESAQGAGRGASITSLQDRPKPRSTAPAKRRVSPLPAAAAVLAVVFAAGLLVNLTTGGERKAGEPAGSNTLAQQVPPDAVGGGSSQNFATDASGAERATGMAGTATAGPAEAGLGGVSASADGGDLGPLDDLDEILRRAEADLSANRQAGSERPCRSVAAESGGLEWQAGVTFKATPAVAYLVSDGAGQRVILVLARSDCSQLARRAA